MKFILFEVYYRVFYTMGAIGIVECFSYFVQGHQLEYFSGLLALHYQAIDFNFYEDLKHYGLQSLPKENRDESLLFCKDNLKQVEICQDRKTFLEPEPLSNFKSNCQEKQAEHPLALSPNEGKAWFYLFIVCLSYFYCVEVDKSTLNSMLMYVKLINCCIIAFAQTYSVFIPGLLKKWGGKHFFILMVFTVSLLLSKSVMYILITSFEELQLEQLDSELL